MSVRDRAARRTGLYRGSSARLLSNHAERSGIPGGRPFGNKPQPELGTEIMSQPARPVHHDIQSEIISYAVWLYYRFSLSLRDVEEPLAERGVTVTYETIRAWCAKFGPSYAAGLRHGAHARATNGIWTRCNSRSKASATGCGGQTTSTAWYSTF